MSAVSTKLLRAAGTSVAATVIAIGPWAALPAAGFSPPTAGSAEDDSRSVRGWEVHSQHTTLARCERKRAQIKHLYRDSKCVQSYRTYAVLWVLK